MSNYCVFNVTDECGKQFKRCREAFGYEAAKDLYYMMKSNGFREKYKDKLEYDENGAPTMESMMRIEAVKNHVGIAKVIESINQRQSDIDDTRENFNMLVEQAMTFNNNPEQSKQAIMTVRRTDEGKIRCVAEQRTPEAEEHFRQQYSTFKLNGRIEQCLGDIGITIGELEAAEASTGTNGKTDFQKAADIATDAAHVIMVADNLKGSMAVSEEFSHLVIGVFRDNPLIQRSIDMLAKNDKLLQAILGGAYQSVSDFYEGNKAAMAEEALGHVLQQCLLDEASRKEFGQPLIDRLCNHILKQFKGHDADALINDVQELRNSMNDVIKEMATGNMELTKDAIAATQREMVLRNVDAIAERDVKILEEALKMEQKRAIFAGKNTKKAEAILDNAKRIKGLMETNTALATASYLKGVLTTLQELNYQLGFLPENTIQGKFKILRDMKDYIDSYGKFLDNLSMAVRENERLVAENEMTEEENSLLWQMDLNSEKEDSPIEDIVTIKDLVLKCNQLSKELMLEYVENTTQLAPQFFSRFFGEEIKVPFGRNKGKIMTIEDLLSQANGDIGFLDRWVCSMADSSDEMLQLFDQAVKDASDITRKHTIAHNKKLMQMMYDFEGKGIKDFTWLYETDDEGNLTGYYVSSINYGQFDKDRKQFMEALNEKYKGKHDRTGYITELLQWQSVHCNPENSKAPNQSYYHNEAYDRIMDNENLADIYKQLIKYKETLDAMYGTENMNVFQAIQMRKSRGQRFANIMREGGGSFWQNIKEGFAAQFLDREDDDAMFGIRGKYGVTDFNGKEFLYLPKFYQNMLANPNELSTDIFATLQAYAYSTEQYQQMSEIVDALEVCKDVFTDPNVRKVLQTRGGVPVNERLRDLAGKVVKIQATQEGNNIAAKLNDFMKSQVYHQYYNDNGSFNLFGKQVNKNKLVSFLMKNSSLARMGFNWLLDWANIMTGNTMIRIESLTGEYFNVKTLAKADAQYAKWLPSHLATMNGRVRNDDMSLFYELFDLNQDFERQQRDDKSANSVRRLVGDRLAFIGQESGNHWMYGRVAIAMAMQTQVQVPNGKGGYNTMSVLDAIEKSGSKDVQMMQLPKGTLNMDGSSFSPQKFGRLIANVNQHLFGIYNEEDRNAAQRTILGRLLMQYRGWITPQMNKRFMKGRKNLTTGKYEEGYYVTFAHLIGDIYRSETRLAMMNNMMRGVFGGEQTADGQQITQEEIFALRRCLSEVSIFLCVCALANWFDWPDDKERPWALKLAEYSAQRLKHELGTLTPSLMMGKEWLKMFESPVPLVRELQYMSDLAISMASPGSDWFNEIESGPYKGMSTLHKNFVKAPIPVVSWYGSIDKAVDKLDTQIQYYLR